MLEQIGFFSGLGVVILFLAAQALGRFTVRSVRDIVPTETYRPDTVVTEPAATRPVTEPVAARPVAPPVVERERTTPVVETERERTAEFEGNRVDTPPAETVRAPAVEHEVTPVSGEGATRVDTRRTP